MARQALFLEDLQILHQIADGEIGRVALAVVAKFLASLEGGDVGHGQLLAAIAAALKDGADEVFVLPGEASEQDGHVFALLGGERPFHGSMEMSGRVQPGNLAQTRALGCEPLLDFRIVFDSDEIRRHVFLHSCGLEFFETIEGREREAVQANEGRLDNRVLSACQLPTSETPKFG